MNRREVVAEFYEILQGLRAKQGGFKLLATCHGKMGWPARGAYFFLEGGSSGRTGQLLEWCELAHMQCRLTLRQRFGPVCRSIEAR